MRPDGTAMLAVPDRWMPVEPHDRLILLSGLPVVRRTSWLRTRPRDECYDWNPPGLRKILEGC